MKNPLWMHNFLFPIKGLDGVGQPYFPTGLLAGSLRIFPLTDANDGDAKPRFPISQSGSQEALRFVNTVPHSLPTAKGNRKTFSARASAETEFADVDIFKSLTAF